MTIRKQHPQITPDMAPETEPVTAQESSLPAPYLEQAALLEVARASHDAWKVWAGSAGERLRGWATWPAFSSAICSPECPMHPAPLSSAGTPVRRPVDSAFWIVGVYGLDRRPDAAGGVGVHAAAGRVRRGFADPFWVEPVAEEGLEIDRAESWMRRQKRPRIRVESRQKLWLFARLPGAQSMPPRRHILLDTRWAVEARPGLRQLLPGHSPGVGRRSGTADLRLAHSLSDDKPAWLHSLDEISQQVDQGAGNHVV